MQHLDAVTALGALAHDHRLTIYRWLVEHGPEGLSAGVIAERLGVPPSSLHRAGLVAQRRVGRQLIYAADFDRMRGLVGFLTENCCAASTCEPAGACDPSCPPGTQAAE